MERLDTSSAESYVSCCVYGKSGSGKTTFGVTAPKPLILLSERQGLVHVRQAAHRLGKPMPPVLYMQSVQDYRNVVRALYGAKDQPFRVFEVSEDPGTKKKQRDLVFELPEWPETVVLDSVTDACRIIIEEIRQQSPPKMGRDGLPVDSERFWNVLADRVRNLVFSYRDAPVHKVFLALADDRIQGEGDDARRQLTLDLPMRKLPEAITAAVNCVGYAFRREKRAPDPARPGRFVTKLIYGVMTTGPEFMTLKPYRPLRDTELPDFTHWVKVIQGEVTAAAVPAPDASQESLQSEAASEDEQSAPASPAAEQTGYTEKEQRYLAEAEMEGAGREAHIALDTQKELEAEEEPEAPELQPAKKTATRRRRAAQEAE